MSEIAVVVDCLDPDAMVGFWTAALGYELVGGVEQYRAMRPAAGAGDGGRVSGPKVIFQAVPEAKHGKNRIHLDIDLDAGVPLDAEVERLAALGARPVGAVVSEFTMTWQVMVDPEGNEFCVVARP